MPRPQRHAGVAWSDQREVIMAWWLGSSLLKRLLYDARSLEQERERRLLDAYARGYRKNRQRHKHRKHRER